MYNGVLNRAPIEQAVKTRSEPEAPPAFVECAKIADALETRAGDAANRLYCVVDTLLGVEPQSGGIDNDKPCTSGIATRIAESLRGTHAQLDRLERVIARLERTV